MSTDKAAPAGKGTLTVKEVIKLLQAMPNKELKMMIDCPYCGKGNQLSSIGECVVLSSLEAL